MLSKISKKIIKRIAANDPTLVHAAFDRYNLRQERVYNSSFIPSYRPPAEFLPLLSKALQTNNNLERLSLSGIEPRVDDCDAFFYHLSFHPTISHLELDVIFTIHLSFLTQLFSRNQSIIHVDFGRMLQTHSIKLFVRDMTIRNKSLYQKLLKVLDEDLSEIKWIDSFSSPPKKQRIN